ncbi:MAG: hypothetical protein JWO46_1560 [Nocardioidaceae bacterium]|nr:hypothetical protein [Nocardioidaceae bacterium]
MNDVLPDRIAVELTTAEARLVVAALRRYEPYWPADTDDLSRAELLAEIRGAIDRIGSSLAR